MLVGIISRPSFITSQFPPVTPELWPLNCPKLLFPLSKSKSFHPVFIKLGEYVVCPKTELAVSALQVELFSLLRNFDDQHFDGRILCQFGALVKILVTSIVFILTVSR